MKITLEDHSAEVYKELEAACQRALEKCGLVGEGYAKKLCPVDTGNLRNSITHTVTDSGERAAYVGTNSEYGIYVECGTGVYGPAHTTGYWVYVVGGDKEKKGKSSGKRYTLQEAKRIVAMLRSQDPPIEAYYSNGQPAKPFIKPAVTEHGEQYKKIIEAELKNG